MDFPLSEENKDLRICIACNEQLQAIKNGKAAELIKAKDYFEKIFISADVGNDVRKIIEGRIDFRENSKKREAEAKQREEAEKAEAQRLEIERTRCKRLLRI